MSQAIIALDRNEYYFDHHVEVLNLFQFYNQQGHSRYAASTDHVLLQNALATLFKVDLQKITLTHGAEDALIKALAWLKLKYKTLVLEDFSWANYNHIAEGLGFQLKKVQTQIKADSFCLNTSELRNYLDSSEPSVVLLTSPNNPTGHEISEKELYALLKSYPKHFFILDMVYAPFFKHEFAPLLCSENSLFVGSFSKFFGLPGLRVGFAIGYLPKAFQLNLGLQPQAIQICQTALQHIDWYQSNRNEMLTFAKSLERFKFKNISIFKTSASFFLVKLPLFKDLEQILLFAEKQSFVRPKFLIKDKNPYLRFGLAPVNVCNKIEDYLSIIDKKFDEKSF
ncbi:pyridoxal phosphate-dependent aminotransferase [Fluviispira sanaruensis]|uniref:Aminotransferase n=1 Tax=Fluviispira sanaruensis TaxID=2493639 RepID=A0A4P2VKA0_FLUSA|nr:pyridoxal phosphate-dependent aminotransferase [Fluviispira sanaruensis]BBH53666.1 histidinol-phosphate aminotransferase family protein [Fluviispira sanaruensis]